MGIIHTFSRPNFFASADDRSGKAVEGFVAFEAARSSCSCALNDIHFDLAITLWAMIGETKTILSDQNDETVEGSGYSWRLNCLQPLINLHNAAMLTWLEPYITLPLLCPFLSRYGDRYTSTSSVPDHLLPEIWGYFPYMWGHFCQACINTTFG